MTGAVDRFRDYGRFLGALSMLAGPTSIAQKMAHLNRNLDLLFAYLRLTKNSVGNLQA